MTTSSFFCLFYIRLALNYSCFSRNIIREATHASSDDELILCPNLTSASNPQLSPASTTLMTSSDLGADLDPSLSCLRLVVAKMKLFSPVVFTSSQIDAATLLPFVEVGGNVVTISELNDGKMDMVELKEALGEYSKGNILSFSKVEKCLFRGTQKH